MNFAGKLALITGGSSGIGFAIARGLASEGAHVWLLARDESKLATALESLQALRRDENQVCGFLAVDVGQASVVDNAINKLEQKVGTPDLLVNSAGAAHPGYFQDLEMDIFTWMLEVNYLGTVHTTRAVLPGMLERGSGHIVNLSSIAGFLGVHGYTAYSASKFAVRGFTDALRAELKPTGVNVSLVYPPDTDTPQLAYENRYKPQVLKDMLSFVGSKPLPPEQVAADILKGISRKKYLILPGFDTKLLFWLASILGTGVYPAVDLIAAIASRRSKDGHKKDDQP